MILCRALISSHFSSGSAFWRISPAISQKSTFPSPSCRFSSISSSSSTSRIQYSASDSATTRTAPHSFDSVHDQTGSTIPAVAFELPIGPAKNEDRIRELTGINPLKFDLSGAIDAIFKFQIRGYKVFPEYMHVELKKRAIATVKSKVNLLRAQGEKVTQDKVDAILVGALHRDGVALARNEDDAVHLLVSETPRIGDERDVEGKPSKVIRRYLVNDNGTTRVVLESELLPPAPADTVIKEYFTVVDEDAPPPVMTEAEKSQKVAEISSAELEHRTNPTRDIAYTPRDIDRVLHEDLLGKEMPNDQTPEEAENSRSAMEEAMFEREINKAEQPEQKMKGPVDFLIDSEVPQRL